LSEEGTSKKALVRSSGIYVILGFLPLGINVLLAPVYTYYLSPEDYGIIGLAQIFNGVISVFLGAGMNQAYARFYFDDRNRKSGKMNLLIMTVSLILFIILAIFPFLWLIGDRVFDVFLQNSVFRFTNYGFIVYITASATVLVGVFQSFFRNEEKPLRYSILSLSFFFLSLAGILLGVVYFEAGAMGNILGRAIGTGAVASVVLLLFYLSSKWKFDFDQVKPMLLYGLPLIPYALLLILFNALDRWVVEHYFGLKTLGFYNFAFVLASSVSVFLYSFYNAVSPRVFKILTSQMDRDKISYQVRLNLELFSMAVLIFIAVALLATPAFLEFFISDQYQVIQPYLGLLFVAYILQLYYVIYTIPFYFEKRTRVLPLIAFLSLVFGALSYYLAVDNFGFYGIIIGLFATKLVQVISTLLLVRIQGKFRLDYLKLNRIHVSSVLSLIFVVLVFWLTDQYDWDDQMAYYLGGIGLLLICLAVYASKLNQLMNGLKSLRR
jgi:O-antigen/teichoic acid export membrane protein